MYKLNLHEIIQDELFDSKSLAALFYLISHGRELEFKIDGKDYFISCHGSKEYVSLWTSKGEQSFKSIDELVETAMIEEKTFLLVWEKAEIQTLF